VAIVYSPVFPRVFLLSPAWLGGRRSKLLLSPDASFEAAVRLRQGTATLREVYAFISGLYFRGKVAYADAFANAPAGIPGAVVIVPGFGLARLDEMLDCDRLQNIGSVPIEEENQAYRVPLLRDAALLHAHTGPDCRYILLGSVATNKYTRPLLSVFGERLLFPADFVGRGDMSRGGLMLRCARGGDELPYLAVDGAVRRGRRVSKLDPVGPETLP
jgi:hypothetical protein